MPTSRNKKILIAGAILLLFVAVFSLAKIASRKQVAETPSGSGLLAPGGSGESANSPTIKKFFEIMGPATTSDIWVPASGNKFVVTDFILVVGTSSAADIITIFDNTSTTANTIFKQDIATSGIVIADLTTPIYSSAINNVLRIMTSTSTTVRGTFIGYEIQ